MAMASFGLSELAFGETMLFVGDFRTFEPAATDDLKRTGTALSLLQILEPASYLFRRLQAIGQMPDIRGVEMEAVLEKEKVEEVVNRLIEICRDGQQGFETAAQSVRDNALQSELKRYGRQRGDFIADLERELKVQGHNPVAYGSIPGVLRRGWSDLNAISGGDNAQAILSACEHGDDAAMQGYRDAAGEPLPSPLKEVILAQHRAIETAHNRIRSLRQTIQH
jgi:uncharacterized protein (TIGR02284 family)